MLATAMPVIHPNKKLLSLSLFVPGAFPANQDTKRKTKSPDLQPARRSTGSTEGAGESTSTWEVSQVLPWAAKKHLLLALPSLAQVLTPS